ncbi:MAG: PQQ-dependent sugar dehydrogenase [Gammaproteobacteria bacterium]|jgi:glucose/arabinose dehydrogenase|nr:PQQ-dependent sugar dehydrogenase [Gammaproteobacteria bacterium]MDH3887419.1 PQQ-dependent sugar dehydrogenase [Gammaproteobacteria bacterium]MDH3934282.1 PQQ-dependent sugar dehydrogenase [Gammaproteobacteria bacterium]MDH3986166.1 PQQ-dependent sugar dehydrogenase [Gammaproteobacteria bacterium]
MRLFLILLLLTLSRTVLADTASLPRYVEQQLKVSGDTWTLTVPAGLQLQVLTDALDQPRMLNFLPNGDLLIGSRAGKVYRLEPPYTHATILVELDDYPHSLAWRAGELLIAQTDGLYRAPYQPGQTKIQQDDIELLAALPGDGGHTSRTVSIGPDRRVYLSLGISGNCSDEYLDKSYPFDDRRGGILVLDESSSQPRWQTFASGLRNPVGFDWHPQTNHLYASNNGPDHLGYDQPPEYFSRITANSFHGMPWFQFDGQSIRRDDCIDTAPPRPRSQVSKPAATFPARNAPMGVTFVPANALDARFRKNALVALKGSWGTQPSGGMSGKKSTRRPPSVSMVQFSNGKAAGVVSVISGFQRPDGMRLARPVGVAIGPDGALYFTSDTHTEGLFRLRPAPQ